MSEVPDLSSLLQTAQEMQTKLAEAQEKAAATEVEGSAGGGAVVVVMTGAGEVVRVQIAPEAVDPDDVEMLQDLIQVAVNDALVEVAKLNQPDLDGLDLGGLDLGGMLGQ